MIGILIADIKSIAEGKAVERSAADVVFLQAHYPKNLDRTVLSAPRILSPKRNPPVKHITIEATLNAAFIPELCHVP
jgi:hypothetical protein